MVVGWVVGLSGCMRTLTDARVCLNVSFYLSVGGWVGVCVCVCGWACVWVDVWVGWCVGVGVCVYV
jgi:hypothetical protein